MPILDLSCEGLQMINRNVNIDLIKCIACIAIVGLHAVGMNNYSIYYLCGCGVPLFFMVNGYLMLSKDSIDYPYIFRKFIQIAKVVFFWNLLITVPVVVFRKKLVNPISLSFKSLLQQGYLWHFWFFGALLLLYLVLPPLHRLCKKDLRIHIFLLLLCFGVCLAMSLLSMKKGYPLYAYVPQTLRLWIWLFFFLLGGIMPVIFHKIQKLPMALHAILFLSSALINNSSLKHISLFITQSRIAEYYYDYISSIVFYFMLFTLLLRVPIKEAWQKKISFASSLTMGIFILHPIILTGVHAIHPISGQAAPIAFWIILTLVSAMLTHFMSKIPLVKELVKL